MQNLQLRLEEDKSLLNAMVADMTRQSDIYRPGPYWERSARLAAKEIHTYGLADFRGMSNLIGLGFTDNVVVDWRLHLRREGPKKRAFYWATNNLFPLNRIYQNQVELTRQYFSQVNDYMGERLRHSDRTKYLLDRYKVPYSLLGGCARKVTINDTELSIHYLELLSQHDYAAQVVAFDKAKSVIEIGGGFGTNIHLLLTNYPNIRKVVYLDIPPNLYIGTQYLRAFYGASVIDYREIARRNSLAFTPDDNLEILCVAPWQLELLEEEADIFLNSHSFVEMPKFVVKNYAEKAVEKFKSGRTAVVLTSYTGFDPTTTFHPDELPAFFSSRMNFKKVPGASLSWINKEDWIYVSPGKFNK